MGTTPQCREERVRNNAVSAQAIVQGASMSCRYSFDDLLALLHGHAPAKVDALALHRRRVEDGHLSVGLKIHCLDEGSQFTCPSRKSYPHVAVMQSAQDWLGYDSPRSLDGSS